MFKTKVSCAFTKILVNMTKKSTCDNICMTQASLVQCGLSAIRLELILSPSPYADTWQVRKIKGKEPELVCQLLSPLSRSKYPTLTAEDERISMPLQTVCLAMFDLIMFKIVDVAAPGAWCVRVLLVGCGTSLTNACVVSLIKVSGFLSKTRWSKHRRTKLRGLWVTDFCCSPATVVDCVDLQ